MAENGEQNKQEINENTEFQLEARPKDFQILRLSVPTQNFQMSDLIVEISEACRGSNDKKIRKYIRKAWELMFENIATNMEEYDNGKENNS